MHNSVSVDAYLVGAAQGGAVAEDERGGVQGHNAGEVLGRGQDRRAAAEGQPVDAPPVSPLVPVTFRTAVAPLTVTPVLLEAGLRLPPWTILSVPAVIVVPPPLVLAPDRVQAPEPCLVMNAQPPELVIEPVTWLPVVVPSSVIWASLLPLVAA